MSYRIRYTRTAREDMQRLYRFLLEHDRPAARRVLDNIAKAMELLQVFPFTCRKISADDPFLRELLISFGSSGFVALYEIEDDNTITVLAVRHQREDDYR